MRCVRCGKEMDKAAAWIGSYPIGPKCLEKMHGKRLVVHSKFVKNEQPDLFGEENELCKNRNESNPMG
jgi:ribosomal protein L35AE/L33A